MKNGAVMIPNRSEKNVTNVVIGKVSGIEKHTKKQEKKKQKKQKNNKVRRQQLSLWNQGKVKHDDSK